MHVQPVVVVNEAQFAEPIHEETDAGARGADHFGERVLTALRHDRLQLVFFPKGGQPQEHQPSLVSLEWKS